MHLNGVFYAEAPSKLAIQLATVSRSRFRSGNTLKTPVSHVRNKYFRESVYKVEWIILKRWA